MRAGDEGSARESGMTPDPVVPTTQSFIVRLWREPTAAPGTPEWRGTVLRVGARRGRSFRTLDGLARRMDELLPAPDDDPVPPASA